MNEIKIRAWDESTKNMVYPSNDLGFTSADILKRYSAVMLYTNVQDKNGKDIYDRDIITNYHGDIQIVRSGTGRWRAVLEKRVKFWPAQYLYCTYMQWEVVGNIYENSELLQELK